MAPGEANSPKFNRYPTKPGSPMMGLVPAASNAAIKPAVCGDLSRRVQVNAQGIPDGFRVGVSPGGGRRRGPWTCGTG